MNDEDRRAGAAANAERLERALSDLRPHLDARRYRDFWREVKGVSSLFKELKPVVREDHERLWSEFGSLCERAKEEQGRERERRDNASRQKRDLVESKVNEAHWQAKGSKSGDDLKVANELLDQALSWMKAGWSQVSWGDDLIHLSDGRMTKADHDACWERWKEVKETIKWRRKEICDFNYGQLSHEAHEAKSLADGSPKEAKEKVRDAHRAMKGQPLEQWQFEEIRKVLDEAYSEATAVQRRRHEAWLEKQEEWRAKMRDAKGRKLERIERLRDVIGKIEHDIDHCLDLQRDARTSDFEDQVQGWIDEKHDKIKDVEESIRELEDSVRDIDRKLAE